MGPTRAQKRWSGRLRTAGALLALLGAVAIADAIIGLASPPAPLAPAPRSNLSLYLGVPLALAGAALFLLGRRWK